MVKSCSAYNCTQRASKGSGISFHGFPKDDKRRSEWLAALRRKNFTPSPHSRICSKHFEKSCYQNRFGKIQLSDTACPTIFDFPAHLKKPKSKRRVLKRSNSERISENNNQSQDAQNGKMKLSDTASPTKLYYIPVHLIKPKSTTRILKMCNSESISEKYNQSQDVQNGKMKLSDTASPTKLYYIPVHLIKPKSTTRILKMCNSESISEKYNQSQDAPPKRVCRKRQYIGDYSVEHLMKSPETAIKAWGIALKMISRKNTLMKVIRMRNERMKMRIKTLENLISHLK